MTAKIVLTVTDALQVLCQFGIGVRDSTAVTWLREG